MQRKDKEMHFIREVFNDIVRQTISENLTTLEKERPGC
jgi:hypothetical protein